MKSTGATSSGGVGSVRAFECRDIVLDLGGRRILDNVSLTAAPAEVVGIAGPNGAGKTTLLDALSGRHRHYRGSVHLNGEPLDRHDHAHRSRAGLARTFQHPVVPVNLSVRDALDAARKAYRPFRSRMQVEWASDLVGLRAPARTSCGSLETLDRRKLLLAALMIRHPKVLLLDEPASGLVSSEISELDKIINTIARELEVAVVVVEHRLELLRSVADRVVVLDQGRVIADGEPGEVFERAVVRSAYFDLDPAVASSAQP